MAVRVCFLSFIEVYEIIQRNKSKMKFWLLGLPFPASDHPSPVRETGRLCSPYQHLPTRFGKSREIFNFKTSGARVIRIHSPVHHCFASSSLHNWDVLVRDPHTRRRWATALPSVLFRRAYPQTPSGFCCMLDMTDRASGNCNTPSERWAVYTSETHSRFLPNQENRGNSFLSKRSISKVTLLNCQRSLPTKYHHKRTGKMKAWQGPSAEFPQELSSACLWSTDEDVVWGLSYFYCLEGGLL